MILLEDNTHLYGFVPTYHIRQSATGELFLAFSFQQHCMNLLSAWIHWLNYGALGSGLSVILHSVGFFFVFTGYCRLDMYTRIPQYEPYR